MKNLLYKLKSYFSGWKFAKFCLKENIALSRKMGGPRSSSLIWGALGEWIGKTWTTRVGGGLWIWPRLAISTCSLHTKLILKIYNMIYAS